jgi:hypothetical protein
MLSKPAIQIGKIGISYNNLTLLTNLWFLCDEIQLGWYTWWWQKTNAETRSVEEIEK